jgi:hypothetical protein
MRLNIRRVPGLFVGFASIFLVGVLGFLPNQTNLTRGAAPFVVFEHLH